MTIAMLVANTVRGAERAAGLAAPIRTISPDLPEDGRTMTKPYASGLDRDEANYTLSPCPFSPRPPTCIRNGWP